MANNKGYNNCLVNEYIFTDFTTQSKVCNIRLKGTRDTLGQRPCFIDEETDC